jgi:hypothetical protein
MKYRHTLKQPEHRQTLLRYRIDNAISICEVASIIQCTHTAVCARNRGNQGNYIMGVIKNIINIALWLSSTTNGTS